MKKKFIHSAIVLVCIIVCAVVCGFCLVACNPSDDDTGDEIKPSETEKLIGTEGLSYSLSYDSTYYICDGIGSATAQDIIIAYDYENLPVKAIGGSAFEDNVFIKSVTIQSNIETIGELAFNGCEKLTSVTFGDGLKTIGDGAFTMTSLKSLVLPDSLKIVGKGAFQIETLETVDLGKGVNIIGETAFGGTAVSSITIPKSVYCMHGEAFGQNCTALRSVVFEVTDGWVAASDDYTKPINGDAEAIPNIDNPETVAVYLTENRQNSQYQFYWWRNSDIEKSFSVKTESVSLNKTSLEIDTSASETLIATVTPSNATAQLVWSTSDDTVAEVTQNGKVTAVGDGSAVITVTSGDKSATCTVTVSSFVYEPVQNGNAYSLIGFKNKNATALIVPTEYKGKPVVSIGDEAFKDCTSLLSVVIPDTVTHIGANVLSGCADSLESLTVPFLGAENNTETNPSYAYFFGMNTSQNSQIRLKSITVTGAASDNSWYANGSYINNLAFNKCGATSVTLGNKVGRVEDGAFEGCKAVEITLPFEYNIVNQNFYEIFTKANKTASVPYSLKKVTVTGGSVGENAFLECSGLDEIVICDGVNLTYGAFHQCRGLKKLTIGNVEYKKNNSYRVLEGLESLETLTITPKFGEQSTLYTFGHLFDNEGDEQKYNKVTYSYSYINSNTNREITASTTAYIPKTLKTVKVTGMDSIARYYFAAAPFDTLYIPNTVTAIEECALRNSMITDIYFDGTVEQWGAITKSINWDDQSAEYTIHCIDGDISKN